MCVCVCVLLSLSRYGWRSCCCDHIAANLSLRLSYPTDLLWLLLLLLQAHTAILQPTPPPLPYALTSLHTLPLPSPPLPFPSRPLSPHGLPVAWVRLRHVHYYIHVEMRKSPSRVPLIHPPLPTQGSNTIAKTSAKPSIAFAFPSTASACRWTIGYRPGFPESPDRQPMSHWAPKCYSQPPSPRPTSTNFVCSSEHRAGPSAWPKRPRDLVALPFCQA